MVAGRPPKYDLDQLSEEIIEWSQKGTSLNLIGFSAPKRMSVTKLPEYAGKHEKFREALQLAKENISQNRFEAACAELMPKEFYSRCEGMYDPLYQRYHRKEKKFEAKLRAQEEAKKNTEVKVVVKNGLGSGIDVSAEKISDTDNRGSQ